MFGISRNDCTTNPIAVALPGRKKEKLSVRRGGEVMPLSEKFSKRLAWLQDSCNGFATAHACLQDWYHMWELILTFSNVALGLLLLTFSLADEKTIQPFANLFPLPHQYDVPTKVRVLMALLAALSVFLSLVDFIMKPAAKAAGHKAAVDKYVESKYAFREIAELSGNKNDEEVLSEYREARSSYLNRENVPTIPELLFPVLRLWHCLKAWIILGLDKCKPS